jgi:hypothetical protein
MNDTVRAHNIGRDYALIWAEFEQTGADFDAASALSSRIGYPLRPLIAAIYGHNEEHAEEVERLTIDDKIVNPCAAPAPPPSAMGPRS